ncbi:ABC transporter substrate-binding protein [Salinarchaeum laminariae]|uniref:ABC transporter substrate-binding protein n=1 Tax=Salinarchaeum laminariae TaxID=869888 RepID=UPI0020BEE13A|nr:ABC transporter substrate-binding protein [Salinarchaeum laminariae]
MSTLAGCVPGGGGGGGDAEGPITIGHLAPLQNPLGVGSKRTANMAVDQISENGGIMDEEVDVIHADTEGNPGTAESEAERLVIEEEVDVMVGTFVSEVTQAIMDFVAQEGVPLIVTGSAAPSTVTEFIGDDYDQYKNFFRTGPINSNFQAEAMVNYVNHLNELHGWDSFALLADDAAWCQPFVDTLPGALDEEGYDLALNQSLNINIDDFSPVINDVVESDADAVIRFFAHINASPFLVERAQRELTFGIEGIHVTGMHPAYAQLTEGAATYETTSQSGGGGTTDITEETLPFVEAYRERFADSDPPVGHPMYMGFNTYDAINVYKEAVERGGTWDYANDLDGIVEAMLETDHTGVAGQIQLYGQDAEYPHDAMETRDDEGTISNFPITQWQPQGALECVYPEQHATAEHMEPTW